MSGPHFVGVNFFKFGFVILWVYGLYKTLMLGLVHLLLAERTLTPPTLVPILGTLSVTTTFPLYGCSVIHLVTDETLLLQITERFAFGGSYFVTGVAGFSEEVTIAMAAENCGRRELSRFAQPFDLGEVWTICTLARSAPLPLTRMMFNILLVVATVAIVAKIGFA